MSRLPQALASAEDPARFIGFMGLMRMELAGVDLYKVGPQLEARVRRNPADANALLDLATLIFLLMDPAHRPMAFSLQTRALALQQVYRLPASSPHPAMRLLAIYGPGDMTANTPLDCLLEGSDVETIQLYVTPGRPLPQWPRWDRARWQCARTADRPAPPRGRPVRRQRTSARPPTIARAGAARCLWCSVAGAVHRRRDRRNVHRRHDPRRPDHHVHLVLRAAESRAVWTRMRRRPSTPRALRGGSRRHARRA